ncbi:hypothetical protein DN752_02935 [Echinicola strongylocentroti]|uniref:Uncharacterized protein n=1 Tax=Echinicola strongylocentroti TaxID=1795355 RepID=A0A2Z4IFB7_9BACT|nr:hypothetical protein [Echinicola strongylocentroti]AWW29178.1 hypothetical protein DN752_02935 [Echinicola strongylocentroti]
MEDQKINLRILEDEALFLGIHQLKDQFVSVFSAVANNIQEQELEAFHPLQKGKKIAKGNELQHCPYQVLDLVRNFDKSQGFNIRFLNWWGHGLYVLVFFGKDRLPAAGVHESYIAHGYEVCLTGSPWDYKAIVKHHRSTQEVQPKTLREHVSHFQHLQFIKHIPYTRGIERLQDDIYAEWGCLKKFHHV